MKDEDIQNLLGGFATDTLTAQERELLFTAALKDQDLFNALADDQALRDFLSDPASRRKVLQLLQPDEPGVFDRLTQWMRRPAIWAVAGGVMAALIAAVVIRQAHPPGTQIAQATTPVEVATSVNTTTATTATAPQPAAPAVEEFRARRDMAAPAPPPAIKRETAVSRRMKVAVLDFDSGPSPAKDAKPASADLGKTASDLLGKKLDSSGYAVIDRKEVDKAVQEQKLNDRQLDASAAASVGRSVGADTVIVGTVKARQAAPLQNPTELRGVVGGARPAAPVLAPKAAPAQSLEVTAQAINTQNAARLGFAQNAQNAAGLSGAVDEVAASLKQQIQQNTRIKIEGLVTDVNAKILTLNVGAKAGVKAGDRLEIRRGAQALGHVDITSSQDSFSVGVFDGPDPARVGDAVVNP